MRNAMPAQLPIGAPVQLKNLLPSERALGVLFLVLAVIAMIVLTIAAITPLLSEIVKVEAEQAILMHTIPHGHPNGIVAGGR
jgi:hypothetical protein